MDLDKLQTHRTIKFFTIISLVIYSLLFLISLLLSIFLGNSYFSPLTNYISELSLLQHTPFPYLYDFACIISGSLTIPITFYIKKTTLHKKNIQNLSSKQYSTLSLLAYLGFISGLLGDIGFVGVGIFSLQRNILGIHYIFAYLLFGGYTFTALIVGFIILLYQTELSPLMGLSGVLYPLIIFLIFIIVLIFAPSFLILYEWIVSLSLTAWLFIFTIYFVYSDALYKP
ncbi:MAG: hypothetical protein EU547_02005 [Promethearchaeota archaeon]|nr:MAG: hypothetical protein EU547_02005 [Candidatus Lokiarchaeota archaeon]